MEIPTFETERLLIRPLKESDANAMYQILSNYDVTKMYGMERVTTFEEAVHLIRSLEDSFYYGWGIRWAIVKKANAVFIGTGGFHEWSSRNSRVEMGYELSPAFWGAGYAKEALSAMISWGFEHGSLLRIGATVMPENKASLRLLNKLSFQQEGTLREYILQDGVLRDVIMHSLLKKDWRGV
ncbi:GNAT family N-acetyltransferase [Aureibacillus halotolerans]|uniref:Ribosomal-protein-alanine N-acetyltransferase n=1 Tax=Aureibacillus halotolerans TaxID=1508390 RepID=A0A4R6U2T3_9BACI|nr:GNAT family protein [Aureibacillus halotolerans]TDQ37424.1 ribosomal-protein-alanine N-acetyltransferase [Aureibacillus halotolerans]